MEQREVRGKMEQMKTALLYVQVLQEMIFFSELAETYTNIQGEISKMQKNLLRKRALRTWYEVNLLSRV